MNPIAERAPATMHCATTCAEPVSLLAGLWTRPCARRARLKAALRCFQGDKEQQLKKATEQIQQQQPSAAEPGGALGALDPLAEPPQSGRCDDSPSSCSSIPSASSSSGGRELDVDAELRTAMRPLLLHTRARLEEGHKGASPRSIASAAVAAAEASGALPPLAGAQRAAVEGFFACMAEVLEEGSGEGGFEAFGTSGIEEPYGEEDAVLHIRPHQTELMEAVINAHLSKGGAARRSKSPSDSVKAGGEVGNIALQSDTHGSAEPHGVPAESGTDRAERQAEAAFEQMELADLPHADAADLERQREWEKHWENRVASAPIEGDAPSAGDGMQVVDSPVEARLLGGSSDMEGSAD